MYVNENGNGSMNGKRKGPLTLLGEITADYLGSTIANPFVASAFRVASRNLPITGVTPGAVTAPIAPRVTAPAALRQLPGIYGVLQRKIEAQRAAAAAPKPSINIVTLPNGTAVPQAILPSSNGGAPAPSAPAPAWNPQDYAGTQGAAGGSSFGPPPEAPVVEVGTLPSPEDGDSTGTPGFSLAGLTPSSPLLLLAAAAAFFLLGDTKPKRRRR